MHSKEKNENMSPDDSSIGSKLTTRERISRDRRALNEIVVTAIIFGFSLNIIADFFTGLPATLNPYNIVLTVFAVVLTGLSFIHLAKQYLGDDCKVEWSFSASLYWNSETASLIQTDSLYLTQEIARFLLTKDKVRKKVQPDALFKLQPDKIQQKRLPVLLDFFESIIRYWIRDSEFYKEPKPVSITSPESSKLLKDPLFLIAANTVQIPGNYSISRKIIDAKSLILEVKWSKDQHGSLIFKVTPEVISLYKDTSEDYIEPVSLTKLIFASAASSFAEFFGENVNQSKIVSCQFNVEVSGIFSPLRLQFGNTDVESLIEWAENLEGKTVLLDSTKSTKLDEIMKNASKYGSQIGLGLSSRDY